MTEKKKKSSANKSDGKRPKGEWDFRVLQNLEIPLGDFRGDIKELEQWVSDPDPYLCDESFPGGFSWKLESASVSAKGETISIARELIFKFVCAENQALDQWCDENVTMDDALLPSHVVGDYETLHWEETAWDFDTHCSAISYY